MTSDLGTGVVPGIGATVLHGIKYKQTGPEKLITSARSNNEKNKKCYRVRKRAGGRAS